MMLSKKFLQKPSVVIAMDDVSKKEEVDPEAPIVKTDKKIRERLRDLVTENWASEDVRLIAWDEKKASWRMWTKA